MKDELFDTYVKKYLNDMQNYASILFKRYDGSIFYKDIVMDALVKTWQHIDCIEDSPVKFRNYWMEVIKHKVIDQIRSVSWRTHREDLYSYCNCENYSLQPEYENDYHIKYFDALKTKLMPKQQELYKWRYKDGMKTIDIAARLNIPHSTAKTRIHSMNNKLKYLHLINSNKLL